LLIGSLIWQTIVEVSVPVVTLVTAAVTATLAGATYTMSRRQVKREQLERAPYLFISGTTIAATKSGSYHDVEIELTNLSQHAVHVRELVVHTDDEYIPEILDVSVFIASAAVKNHKFRVKLTYQEQGSFRLYFRYGPTGPLLHRVAVTFRYEPRRYKTVDGFVTRDHFSFSFNEGVESGVESEQGLIDSLWEESQL